MSDLNIETLIELCEALNINYKLNETLAPYTSFKIGGPGQIIVFPDSGEIICSIIKCCNENSIPVQILGRGANTLISDEGVAGCIIQTAKYFTNIIKIDETSFYAAAGTTISALCNYALEESLTGLEFAWGIPATVGGAIYMNAGAYGGEVKDILVSAKYLADGEIVTAPMENLKLSYRHSVFKGSNSFILGGVFKLQKGDKHTIKGLMEETLQKRKDKQPLEYPSAGSTFKRPEGAFAAALIQDCGLKGLTVGGAQVSTKHSGFVINTGGASCKDVLTLIDMIKEKVETMTGYKLECEVEII